MTNVPNTQKVRSTWQLGQQAEFRFKFLRKDSSPIIPVDPTKFPSFAIYAPSGVQVFSGVATPFGSPGGYRVLWTVPVDAELSNDRLAWVLEATLVDAKKKQFTINAEFNVIDKQVTSAEDRDLIKLGVEGMPYRVVWRGDFVPSDLSVSIFRSDYPDQQEFWPIQPTTMAGLTGPVDSGDSIVYYLDVPGANLKAGLYTILWQVTETVTSPPETEFQQLRLISKNILQLIPQVRFIFGRFTASVNLANYVSDADIIEALWRGLEYINQWHPISYYGPSDIMPRGDTTTPLFGFWMMAAAWYILQSQHLVEAGLAFNLSGATTSLDYDRTSPIESAIGRLREEFTQNLTQAKISYKIRKQGFGHVSLRPARFANLNNRVWQIDKTSGMTGNSQIVNLLTQIGLNV
jgi:hypothetical protein